MGSKDTPTRLMEGYSESPSNPDRSPPTTPVMPEASVVENRVKKIEWEAILIQGQLREELARSVEKCRKKEEEVKAEQKRQRKLTWKHEMEMAEKQRLMKEAEERIAKAQEGNERMEQIQREEFEKKAQNPTKGELQKAPKDRELRR